MADTYSRPSNYDGAKIEVAALIYDAGAVSGSIQKTLPTVAVTQGRQFGLTIPASTTLTITVADEFGTGVKASVLHVAMADSSSSSDMNIEINNSGVKTVCEDFCTVGDASITQVEIGNTSLTDALKIMVHLAS